MESSTPVTTSNTTNTNTNRSNKKTADTDLKSSIIEFMRERPFLWNSKHPNYKDHKRREHEFQIFSSQIACSVQEIKRVWHVLRTNFFRAHKLLLDRPQSSGENGEKLWKYYLAMEYILESTDSDDLRYTSRQTRSSKASKDIRGTNLQKELNNNNKNCSNLGGSSSCNSSRNSSCNNNNSINNGLHNKSSTLNDSSMEADDDHLYARSLTSTLKRFDPTTKEVIKLKFQEIIVSYMQKMDVTQELAACTTDLQVTASPSQLEKKWPKPQT